MIRGIIEFLQGSFVAGLIIYEQKMIDLFGINLEGLIMISCTDSMIASARIVLSAQKKSFMRSNDSHYCLASPACAVIINEA